VNIKGKALFLRGHNDRPFENFLHSMQSTIMSSSKKRSSTDINAFFRLCERGDCSLITSTNKNNVDNLNHTALQVAAANDQRDVLKTLLSFGADSRMANKCGWTPLHHSAIHGHTEICEMLLSKDNGLINLRNRFGSSPLNVAVAGGHLSTVK